METTITKEYVYEEIKNKVRERREKNIIPDGILVTDFSRHIEERTGAGSVILRRLLNELFNDKKIGAYPTMHGLAIKLL